MSFLPKGGFLVERKVRIAQRGGRGYPAHRFRMSSMRLGSDSYRSRNVAMPLSERACNLTKISTAHEARAEKANGP